MWAYEEYVPFNQRFIFMVTCQLTIGDLWDTENKTFPIPTIPQVWVIWCQYFEKWRAKLSQGKDKLHLLFSCQQPLTLSGGRLPHHKQAACLSSLLSSFLLDIKEAALTELIGSLKPAIPWHSCLYSSKVVYCVEVAYVLIPYFSFH